MGPGDLARALCGLELQSHPDLLVGLEHADDAGVYRLTDEIALVQTVDFFTPIVDDPYLFGQIAAANALSDVYAMGGKPLTAMNLVAFPVKKLDMSVLQAILRGGLDKLREADVVLVGGHSIDDPELKYGLSVTGTVHPSRFYANRGGRPGDVLVLTKPLGTGVVNTALKRGKAAPEVVERVAGSMCALNRVAAEVLQACAEVHACTDVTGFGLLGHACEMVEGCDVGLRIEAGAVPLFPAALDYARQGLTPGGLRRNREFRQALVDLPDPFPAELADLLYDPQTSGGLLAAVPRHGARELLEALRSAGIAEAAVVGEVIEDPPGRVVIVP